MTAPSVPADRVVDPGYQHYEKVAGPAAGVPSKPGLKWYDIHAPDVEVSSSVRVEALQIIGSDSEFASDDLGFVILHRCGESFYFLLVSRWRNSNELWQTVYTKNGPADFELSEGAATRAVFCVWELGVVGYERLAWTAYLRSPGTTPPARPTSTTGSPARSDGDQIPTTTSSDCSIRPLRNRPAEISDPARNTPALIVKATV